jgi:hypothetical protein
LVTPHHLIVFSLEKRDGVFDFFSEEEGRALPINLGGFREKT